MHNSPIALDISDPDDFVFDDYCTSSNGNKNYSEFRHHTFNTGIFVNYKNHLCLLKLISAGPKNYYTLNLEKQRVQVNGYIHCFKSRYNNTIAFTKKIRFENLKGTSNYSIESSINPYADISFF